MNALSPWVRRIVALGLLIILIALVWGGCIIPLRQWSSLSVETLRDAEFELARVTQAVSESKSISVETVAVLEQLVGTHVVAGGNEAEAITQAQSMLDRLLKDQGVALEAIQTSNSQNPGALKKISFDVRARGTEPKVVKFLAELEKAVPLLQIEKLVLRGQSPAGGSQSVADAQVAVELTVTAYWKAPLNGGVP
jgi:glycine cleavage system regulatory protein